jgi:ferredoxin
MQSLLFGRTHGSVCVYLMMSSAKHCNTTPKKSANASVGEEKVGELIRISFIEGNSEDMVGIMAPLGKSVLDAAVDNDVDIEGACGGELACSTCHVILAQELYDSLPPKKEEEEDMLDLAWGLTPTSRLCCQIKVTPQLEGALFRIPEEAM